MGVEWLLRHRITGRDDELAALRAEPSLVSRSEIEVVGSRVGEVHPRIVGRDFGHLDPEVR
jgi:hypothetical protein